MNCAHNPIDIYDTKNKHKLPGYSPQERKSFGDFLTSSNFVDSFRHFYPDTHKYSFWSVRSNLRPSNRGWRLDYFLVNKIGMSYVKDSMIHNQYMGSDHCPIELAIDFSGEEKKASDEKEERKTSPVKTAPDTK